jgi:hypothetical protein
MPDESRPDNSAKKKGMSDSPVAGVLAEFLFVLLPLIVILIIRLSQGLADTILTCPEFSFAAAILFGHSIIKLVSASAALGEPLNWQNLAAIVSALIVLGLAPSLTVLGLILLSTSPSTALRFT